LAADAAGSAVPHLPRRRLLQSRLEGVTSRKPRIVDRIQHGTPVDTQIHIRPRSLQASLRLLRRQVRAQDDFHYSCRCNFGRGPALRLHPASLAFAPKHIEVEVARRSASSLILHYGVTGNISDLRLPSVTAPARTAELWRHTCFEVFIRSSSGTAYYEFNFAPSTQWAAYWFRSYRSGMRVATEISAPRIKAESSIECYTLQASLNLDHLTSLPPLVGWRLGLSAVIEETSGHKSYWAFAHPPGRPDFHHSDCFVYEFS
jgi:hypothetical protein